MCDLDEIWTFSRKLGQASRHSRDTGQKPKPQEKEWHLARIAPPHAVQARKQAQEFQEIMRQCGFDENWDIDEQRSQD
jgi:hypothetical protein